MTFSLSQPRTRTCLASAMALAALAVAPVAADAGPIISTLQASAYGLPAIGGAVIGIDLTGDVGTSPVTVNPGANAVTITPAGGGQIVQGSVSNYYAAPVTGGTVANPIQTAAPYLSTEKGTITLSFAQTQSFFGLLWGSVGAGDQIDLYNDNTGVATYTGTQVMNAAGNFNSANGAQGFGGSDYTLINLIGGTFNKIVLSQNVANSFEAANFEYAAANQTAPTSVPEPASMALLSIGLLGIGCVLRRKRVKAESDHSGSYLRR